MPSKRSPAASLFPPGASSRRSSVGVASTPRKVARQRMKREPACKPGSVEGNHSSGIHVAVNLKRPTRKRTRICAALSRLRLSLR